METKRRVEEIRKELDRAEDYQTWRIIAQKFDDLPSVQEQINEVYSPYYDYSYIQELLLH